MRERQASKKCVVPPRFAPSLVCPQSSRSRIDWHPWYNCDRLGNIANAWSQQQWLGLHAARYNRLVRFLCLPAVSIPECSLAQYLGLRFKRDPMVTTEIQQRPTRIT